MRASLSSVRWVLLTASLLAAVLGCEPFDSGGDDGFPRNVEVQASEEGYQFTAPEAATYRFTITGGAYQGVTPSVEWFSRLYMYDNRPILWDPLGRPVSPSAHVGNWSPFPSAETAAAASTGAFRDVTLAADQYVIMVVPDSTGNFGDNEGEVKVRIEQFVPAQ